MSFTVNPYSLLRNIVVDAAFVTHSWRTPAGILKLETQDIGKIYEAARDLFRPCYGGT
jgi:hypothetical protein